MLFPGWGCEDLSCLGFHSMVPDCANEAKFIADYLLSRAQAALESTDALENGHAQYVASMAGTWGWGPVALLASCIFLYIQQPSAASGPSASVQCPGDGGTWWVEWVGSCELISRSNLQAGGVYPNPSKLLD